jgi:hypothetical protein
MMESATLKGTGMAIAVESPTTIAGIAARDHSRDYNRADDHDRH